MHRVESGDIFLCIIQRSHPYRIRYMDFGFWLGAYT